MDNVSHTVAGLLAAETLLALHRSRSATPLTASFGRVAWITSAIANNLPDSDLAYRLIDQTNLGYLLHHRGHTHTLAIGIPLGMLALLVPWLWAKHRRHVLSREEWGLLVALAVLGPLLHMALDFTNNYGVHPFWPLDSRWRYGDTIFIVEPFFWVTGLSLLLPSVRSRAGKLTLWFFLVVGVVLPWVAPFVSWQSALFLTLLAVALWFVGRKTQAAARMTTAVALSVAAVIAFGLASRSARATIERRVAADFPGWMLHDAVLTPLPSDPLCLETIVVMTRGEDYALRRAQVASWPSLRPVDGCPAFSLSRPKSAPMAPIGDEGSPSDSAQGLIWVDEFVMPVSRIRSLPELSCEGDAFLRFARAPFVLEKGIPEAPGPLMGDLRYDNEAGQGFAEIPLTLDPSRCPRWIPQWVPPRADVLYSGG